MSTPSDVLAQAIARLINIHKHGCPEAAQLEPEPWMTAAAQHIAKAIAAGIEDIEQETP